MALVSGEGPVMYNIKQPELRGDKLSSETWNKGLCQDTEENYFKNHFNTN